MEQVRGQYTSSRLSGLGSSSRPQLSAVLRQCTGTVTPEQAASVLSLSRTDGAKLLARWASQGWLNRVRRGIYVPVPLESEVADAPPEDAWIIAEAAFAPCFLCGWTAAEHWGLTEQVFRTVLVSTKRRPRERQPVIGGIPFWLRTVGERGFFGLRKVWRGRMQIRVTDPSRTILDLMADPALGGGLRSSTDMLRNYLASKELRNVPQLLQYADTLAVGAVLTQGNAKLDPALPEEKLVTAWRLWLPKGWEP
jgi:predicted transcriptional regulator of viral defense system